MGRYLQATYDDGTKWRAFEASSEEEAVDASKGGEVALSLRFEIKDVKKLEAAWQCNESIKVLILRRIRMSSGQAASISAVLKENKTITTLDLRENEIDKDGAASLAAMLKENKTLAHLYLGQNDIGPDGAATLAESLVGNNSLITLSLEQNRIGTDGASSLANCLKGNSTLTALNLLWNGIDEKGAAALAGMLKGNKTITSLNLRANYIRKNGAASLAEALQESTVTQLNLAENEIGPNGAASLAKSLKKNITITTLNLEWNEIGPIGAASLAKSLMENKTLTTLNLRENLIDGNGAASLAAMLKENKTLSTLNLTWNRIGPGGAASLADSLKENETLTTLDLLGCELGDDGATSLAEMLKGNRTLTSLDLERNNIEERGASSLAAMLNQNKTLTRLNLYENHLSLESMAYLAACASFRIDGIDYTDLRIRAAQAHGVQARELGIFPSHVPQEVLDRDSRSYASNTEACLEGMLFSEDAVHQLKVLLVGPQQAGKTSIRRALKTKGLEANPTQGDHAGRATISVDIDQVQFDEVDGIKGGRIALWDFGGQEEYYMTHAFFLSNRSLVMVVVDLEQYEDTDDKFETCAGRWLRALQMQIYRPKVVVVGTKCDTQSKDQIEAKMNSLQQRVGELGTRVRQAIKEKSQGKTEEEQEMQRLVDFEGLSFTEPKSFVVSGTDVSQGDGMAVLYAFLREHATNTDKGIALRVPTAFEELRELVEKKRDNEGKLAINLHELQREAGLEGQDIMFRLALGLMHDLGIFLWYENSEKLCDVVFSNPVWVVEMVRQVFRHDLFQRREGDRKEGALYDLEVNDSSVDLEGLQRQLKEKCILDERLLRLFPVWKSLDSQLFETCLNLLQQFELMYKLSSKDVAKGLPRQYVVPLFLRSGFAGLHHDGRQEAGPEHDCVSERSCFSVECKYNFFVFIPDGFLFRVIARTFRLAEFTKLSERKATAKYVHESGACIAVELTSDEKSDGSGVFSVRSSCVPTSGVSSTLRALEVLNRTLELLVREVDQLLDESFRFVPFEMELVMPQQNIQSTEKRLSTPRRKRAEQDPSHAHNGELDVEAKETENSSGSKPSTPRRKTSSSSGRKHSVYVSKEANDFSYFSKRPGVVKRKLNTQDRYMVKKYCFDAILQQLEKADRQRDHLIHVGKDIRGKLLRTFQHDVSKLCAQDPLKQRLEAWEMKEESSLTQQDAETFLKLVRCLLTRLRTEFDCFLAHKWGDQGVNHQAVKELSQALKDKGMRCWVDSNEMKDSIKEMLKGIDHSQVFVACVTEDYLDAVGTKGTYCSEEYNQAVAFKSSEDLVVMFLDEDMADPDLLQELPRAAWKLYCCNEAQLFHRVLEQLFPLDDAADREALLQMYPAESS